MLQPRANIYSHIVTNPTSYIVTVAEHAAAKILALSGAPGGTPGNGNGNGDGQTKRAGAVRRHY
jgi:cellobiose dehydrogenase (acceptor)